MNLILRHIGITFLFLTSAASAVLAQSAADLPGAEAVNSYAYSDINGSPYLLDSFTLGTIYGSNMTVYKDLPVNYNGKTQMLEVILAGQTYELDPSKYLRVEIETGRADVNGRPGKMILQRGVHKRFENAFIRVVYRGRRIILADQFTAEIEDSATELMSRKEKLKRFRREHGYFLKHHSDIHPVQLNSRSVSKIFGHEEEMEAYIMEKALDVSMEDDMSQLLKWYENKGFVR